MKEIIQFINYHQILSILWLSSLSAVLFFIFKDITSKIKIIDNIEAINLINKENAIIIDLRKSNEFDHGHIIGSINLLPNEIKYNNLSRIDKYKETPIIIVDTLGIQSDSSANLLYKIGFKKVFVLKYGINGWIEKNLPLVSK